VGEAMQPVRGPDCWYVVIEPGVSVPTAQFLLRRI
jgi:4-diphosphocytidyl-2-C-methyl-D-erythritol kinase